MAKAKFYAVKGNGGVQIVTSWDECKRLTHGVKGVLFKAFGTSAEAKAWLSGVSEAAPAGLRIYVDGSYLQGFGYSGWAFVAVDGDSELARKSGVTSCPAESRNIDGELKASIEAMKWLKAQGKFGVVCHDYEGVARFAKGEWQAKSAVAKRYAAEVRELGAEVAFEKVAAHTGQKWNELADKLAKQAIAEAREGKEAEPKNQEQEPVAENS